VTPRSVSIAGALLAGVAALAVVWGSPSAAASAGLNAPGCVPSDTSITVATTGQLTGALASLTPGESIILAPGTYLGNFTDSVAGTASDPVTICGPASAVLDGGSLDHGYTLYLDGANHTTVSGLTVTHGLKGIVADDWQHGVIDAVTVKDIGQEGIHLRKFSSNDLIERSTVSGTGLSSAANSIHYGEGIYIGSAYENWPTYTHGQPDRCDHDRVIDNTISDTTAESVDIKEGTTGGTLSGNSFDGTGMNLSKGADSWVDVKGNDWLISDNTGTTSPRDGYQVHIKVTGWGRGNVFADNHVTLNNRGYGFYISGAGTDSKVRCSNVVVGRKSAFTNAKVSCQGVRLELPAAPGRHWIRWLLIALAAAIIVLNIALIRRRRRGSADPPRQL
jgi:hypothetical protein